MNVRVLSNLSSEVCSHLVLFCFHPIIFLGGGNNLAWITSKGPFIILGAKCLYIISLDKTRSSTSGCSLVQQFIT
jgi:hypothetical protein